AGDQSVGAVNEPEPAAAKGHQLPLQVRGTVVGPLLEPRPGGDAAAAVHDQPGGVVGDLGPAGGNRGRAQGGDLPGEDQLDHVGVGGERRVGRRQGDVQAAAV